ncbi:MAG: VWA domain-containing protein [Acetobacter sp.]|nr:VWA domain-containing protein [Acetobacter sp.]
MIEFLQNFHFLRPWLLLFLFLPLGLYLKKTKFSTSVSSWEDICDANLLKFLLVNEGETKKLSAKKFIYIGLIFTTLAAAGPCWKKDTAPTFVVENPYMFVMSLAQDMRLKDVAPSRLDRAKFVLSDITDELSNGQFGLEVYSNEPYIITPLTDDTKLIKSLLPQVTPDIVPDQGDRLDRAIDLAIERFKTAGYSNGNIILFASDVGQRYDLALEKVKTAVAHNYHIYVVDTSYSGNEKLQFLAETGNGVYMNVQETSPQKILQQINNVNLEKMTISDNLRSDYVDYGYYLIFIPILCVLMFFRRGLLVLLLCCFASQAYAGFWQNNTQEGFLFFKKGQYDEALQKFDDPSWRGITFYKQNKLEDSLKEFSKLSDIEALYNKGVVQTKLCQYDDALKTFEEVLKQNVQHQDALHNKQILVDLFEKSKNDPSLLECNNQNQQQNDKPQDQQNQEKQQNDSNQNQQQDKDNPSSNQNNDETEKQNNDDNSNNQSSEKDSGEKNSKEDTSQNDTDKNQDTSNQAENINNESNASDDTLSNADNNIGPENESNNEQGDDKNGEKEQNAEQDVSLVNAQKGNQDEKYDEEALAIQRKYREIPEDTGGLLREFIKKEYMKDRYKNENM